MAVSVEETNQKTIISYKNGAEVVVVLKDGKDTRVELSLSSTESFELSGKIDQLRDIHQVIGEVLGEIDAGKIKEP